MGPVKGPGAQEEAKCLLLAPKAHKQPSAGAKKRGAFKGGGAPGARVFRRARKTINKNLVGPKPINIPFG